MGVTCDIVFVTGYPLRLRVGRKLRLGRMVMTGGYAEADRRSPRGLLRFGRSFARPS